MSMPPSLCYERSGLLHFGIGQTSEMRNASQFRFHVFKKQIVMRDQPLLLAGRLDQAPVIDFPKPQPKRIRSSVSLLHGVGDFQRIAHHDERLHAGQQVLPKRQCQTVARIFPAPETCRTEPFNEQPGFHPQRIQSRMFEGLVSFRWEIPCATELVQQFIIQRNEPKMFPKTIGVIGLRRHQFVFWTEVEATDLQ